VRHAAEPGSTVVVLVGNAHARKTKIDFGDSSRKPFMPMAGLLPADRTLTLDAVGNGGTAWFCSGPTPEDCGPHDAGALRESHPRGVELEPVMGGAYNGVLELGVPTTASPPQTAP
jgi:hypothetical protein